MEKLLTEPQLQRASEVRVVTGIYLEQLGAVVQVSLAALESFPVVTHDCGQSLLQICMNRSALTTLLIPENTPMHKPAHLCVYAGRGQVLVSLAPLLAECNSRVQQLQPSPEAIEPLQHVLHTGLEVLLNLKESKQRSRPVTRKCAVND